MDSAHEKNDLHGLTSEALRGQADEAKQSHTGLINGATVAWADLYVSV